jgi:Phosphate transporter family
VVVADEPDRDDARTHRTGPGLVDLADVGGRRAGCWAGRADGRLRFSSPPQYHSRNTVQLIKSCAGHGRGRYRGGGGRSYRIDFRFHERLHDTANAMATSIATGALQPRVADAIAGVLNLAGAFLSVQVAKTISGGLVDEVKITPAVIFAGLVGAILWNLLTWLLRDHPGLDRSRPAAVHDPGVHRCDRRGRGRGRGRAPVRLGALGCCRPDGTGVDGHPARGRGCRRGRSRSLAVSGVWAVALGGAILGAGIYAASRRDPVAALNVNDVPVPPLVRTAA